MKIVPHIFRVTLCISLVFLFAILPLNETNYQESETSFRPHIMVNNQIYWLSAYPCDEGSSQRSLTRIGQVEENVDTHPEHNFQAYGVVEGTQVYLDDLFPHIVYLRTANSFDCYVTAEMSMDYVYFAGSTYVSLSSLCAWDYEQYEKYYVPIYGDEISKSELPGTARLVGETTFVGYHMPVKNELETNAFCNSVSVYKEDSNLNILYVGTNNMIYVLLE